MTSTERRASVAVKRDNFTFSAAHFAQFPDGTSEPLHGHNYQVEICVAGEVDAFGFIVDFHAVKQATRAITTPLNHRVLLPGRSARVVIIPEDHGLRVQADGSAYLVPLRDACVLPIKNTTCECLAGYIADALAISFPDNTVEVIVCESEGQSAAVRIKGRRTNE